MNNSIKDYNKKSMEWARENIKEKRKSPNYKGGENELLAIHAPLISDEYFVIGRPCPITGINIATIIIGDDELDILIKGECEYLVGFKTHELMKIYA